MKNIFSIIVLLFCQSFSINAQDIRGAEITLSDSGFYEFLINVNLYTQTGFGINHSLLLIHSGDGTIDSISMTAQNLPHDITVWHGSKSHTYTGNGSYNIHVSDSFRIANITNINNSGSEIIYLETVLYFSSFVINSSPVINNNQTHIGISGGNYIYQPNAVDPDGDSLSYTLVPATSSNYSFPPGAFIDSITGEFQMPIISGTYAINIKIQQWRHGFEIGTTHIEMIIDSLAASGINSPISESIFIKIFPNPSDKFLNIQLSGMNKDAQIRIYDILGKNVYESNLISNEMKIEVSDFAPGVYVIEVNDQNSFARQKFIKE